MFKIPTLSMWIYKDATDLPRCLNKSKVTPSSNVIAKLFSFVIMLLAWTIWFTLIKLHIDDKLTNQTNSVEQAMKLNLSFPQKLLKIGPL